MKKIIVTGIALFVAYSVGEVTGCVRTVIHQAKSDRNEVNQILDDVKETLVRLDESINEIKEAE